MAEAVTKLPVKTEEKKTEEKASAVQAWRPFESLRCEVDRLFEDFDRDFWQLPFRRPMFDIDYHPPRRQQASYPVPLSGYCGLHTVWGGSISLPSFRWRFDGECISKRYIFSHLTGGKSHAKPNVSRCDTYDVLLF